MVDFQLRMEDSNWAAAEEEPEGEDILWHYLWELTEVYDVPLTNNYPRAADGRNLRMVFDCLGDIREAFVRAGWRPETKPRDLEWQQRFPDIKPFGDPSD